MSRKQLVVEQARRILGTYEAAAGAIAQLNAGAALESMPTGFESTTRSTSRTGGASAVAEATPVGRAIAEERAAQVQEGVEAMKKIELGRDDITPREQEGLEAIILLTGRPAILIQEGDFMEPPALWTGPQDRPGGDPGRHPPRRPHRRVEQPELRVAGHRLSGRQRRRDHQPSRRRRVLAAVATMARGRSATPMRASVNLKAELGSEDALTFKVTSIIGIHEDHDMAALKVEQVSGAEQLPDPLTSRRRHRPRSPAARSTSSAIRRGTAAGTTRNR